MDGTRAVSIRLRVSRAGYLFLGLTISFGVQAVLAGNNLLFLLFAFMLGFILALAALTLAMPWGITVSRLLPAEGYAGDPYEYALEIRNERRLFPAYCLTCSDHFGSVSVNTLPAEIAELGCGQAVTRRLGIANLARGWLGFSGVEVRCRFPFGLFEAARWKRLEARVLVLPQRWAFRASWHATGLEGAALAMQAAQWQNMGGMDFAGLREFHPGDHPRQIHWHASSRFPSQILSRQFEPDRDRHTVIVLDSFCGRQPEPSQRAAFEDNICLAIALAERFLDEQFTVTVAFWSAAPSVVQLIPAVPDLRELRRSLAVIEPNHDQTLLSLTVRVPQRSVANGLVLRLPGGEDISAALPLHWIQLLPGQLKPFITVLAHERAAGRVL